MEYPGVYGNRTASGHCDLLNRSNVEDDEPLIVKIMKPDFDITTMNCELLLRLSITNGRNNIAHVLIEKGVDIDCIDPVTGNTPLHLAIIYQQYEAACMLLYYDASPEIKSSFDKDTPFMLALKCRSDHRYAELLYDYVFDFKAINSKGENVLYLALMHQSPLTQKILAQCDIKSTVACLKQSIRRPDPMTKEKSYVFKYLFPRVDHAELAQKYATLLDDLLEASIPVSEIRDAKDFMECFYLVLNSDYAQKFVQKCTTLIPLIHIFIRYNMIQSDRLSCLYSLLSLGVNITFEGFDEIYRYFGFNEELEAILETRPNIGTQKPLRQDSRSAINIAYIIFYTYQHHYDMRCPLKPLKNFNRQFILNDYLEFFTFTYYFELRHIYVSSKPNATVNEYDVPSLKEVSRNVVRNTIISSKLAKGSMYKVYDAIKMLPVPKIIQDILHLKYPLYK